jgi:thiol-disulfide isomerase/thioredoxin
MDAAKNGGKPGDKAALNYAISVAKRNQAVDAGAFAFNVNGSTAVGSLEEWARGPHATQDKDAPRVTLKFTDGVAYDLAKDKSQVIVLDFWATWCGPCRESMPELEQVRKWAAENKKPVGIYLVNLRESAEKINAALKEDKVNLASLMDTDGKVAESYGVEGIPHLVVIEGGKIRKVHIGNTPGKGEKLKKEIDALLNKKS